MLLIVAGAFVPILGPLVAPSPVRTIPPDVEDAGRRPERCAAFVQTFGAGRVNLQAGAEILAA